MRYLFFLLFIALFLDSPPLNAQIIGDEALQQLQSGQVSFLDGEFIVFLNDTVSPKFIVSKFEDLNYAISFIDIHPILISLVNSPQDSVLTRLKNHPLVSNSFIESEPVDTAFFEGILIEQGLSGDEFNTALARLLRSQSTEKNYIEFHYSINSSNLKKIMSNFRSVAYQIERDIPRSVNVSCKPGEEQDIMSKIDQLPFVGSTALIGVLK